MPTPTLASIRRKAAGWEYPDDTGAEVRLLLAYIDALSMANARNARQAEVLAGNMRGIEYEAMETAIDWTTT